MRGDLSIRSAELRKHLLEELLPLWFEHGVDRERGGFHPELTRELRPGPRDFKRLVSQTRQIYAFSQAALLGAPAWSLEAAAHGVEFLQEKFWDPRYEGWYLTTELAGQPRDRRKDSYAHAFVLFAMAFYHRASGDSEALRIAERTLDLLERHLADPEYGGFLEGASESWQPVSEVRRANPHMHLLEAFLALYQATQASRYLEHSERLVRLFQESFLDRERGALGEYFSDDWKPQPGDLGQVLEPGHHFEWVWLLHQYASLSSTDAILGDARALFHFATEAGVDPDDGGVFDEINRAGVIVRDTKRLWPQTEFVKALNARFETFSDGVALERLEQALSYCFSHYVDPEHHGWNDHLTREGKVFSEYMPATSVYHITLALSEVIRVQEQPQGRN